MTCPLHFARVHCDFEDENAFHLEFSPVLIGGAGSSHKFTRIAGQTLSALNVVWEDADGKVYPLDAHDDDHIDLVTGVTTTAALSGHEITLQAGGVLDIGGLNLLPGRVWLGANGALTQTPPTDGYDLLVGRALSDDRLFINLFDHITL